VLPELVVLLALVPLWLAPGRVKAIAPVASTPATPTPAVTADNRFMPRLRSTPAAAGRSAGLTGIRFPLRSLVVVGPGRLSGSPPRPADYEDAGPSAGAALASFSIASERAAPGRGGSPRRAAAVTLRKGANSEGFESPARGLHEFGRRVCGHRGSRQRLCRICEEAHMPTRPALFRRVIIGGAMTAGLLAGGVGVAMAATSASPSPTTGSSSSSAPSSSPSSSSTASPHSGSGGTATPGHHNCPNMGNRTGGSGGSSSSGASASAYLN
jgi:hypothetical protein